VRNSLNQEPAEGQHDGLGLSVGDAADLLGRDTPEGREFGGYADELFEARAREAASREPLKLEGEPDGSIWMRGYFRKPSHAYRISHGSFDLQLYRRTKCEWFADAVVETSRWQAAHMPPPPPNIPVLAKIYLGPIDTALTAHELTGEPEFLAIADKFAGLALDGLFRNEFLMGASNMKIFRARHSSEYAVDPWAEPPSPGFYFSVSGTPLLCRNLLRVALRMEGEEDFLGCDQYSR